ILYSMLNLSHYVNFCLRLLLLFGLIFELPLILLILSRTGLVTVDFLKSQRRLAILLSAVIAAFHADLVTMTVVAAPMYGMYEFSILLLRLVGERHRPAPAAAAANPAAPDVPQKP
ncbi:MAG: twin-arginine translocase subunit TatC, partial [Deltaproteobacteria bacterium]|nr:twin-arginine translocase subunit TatC [Deltaproteobacteria bacterium]